MLQLFLPGWGPGLAVVPVPCLGPGPRRGGAPALRRAKPYASTRAKESSLRLVCQRFALTHCSLLQLLSSLASDLDGILSDLLDPGALSALHDSDDDSVPLLR